MVELYLGRGAISLALGVRPWSSQGNTLYTQGYHFTPSSFKTVPIKTGCTYSGKILYTFIPTLDLRYLSQGNVT